MLLGKGMGSPLHIGPQPRCALWESLKNLGKKLSLRVSFVILPR